MKGSSKSTNDKGTAERSLFSFINDMYGGGSLLEMELLKDVRLKLEVRDYHGFRFRLDSENSKYECLSLIHI